MVYLLDRMLSTQHVMLVIELHGCLSTHNIGPKIWCAEDYVLCPII